MTSAPYATASCSHCGKRRRLLKNGTVGHHGAPQTEPGTYDGRSHRCPGAGKPPAEQPELDGGPR